jgi:hypothetical protein
MGYRNGERRHARYEIAMALRPIPRVEIDSHGNCAEPA